MKAAHTHCCGCVTQEIVYNGKIPNTDTDIAIFQNTDTEYRTDVIKYRQKYRIPIPTSNTATDTPLQCTVLQYHSDLSDQSALEIWFKIRVRLRVALFSIFHGE